MKMPLLKELQLKYKELKKQIPKGQVTGENISLNDSSDLPYEDFKINGKSEQKNRSGKNLYNYKNTSSITSGITTDENGWITVSYDNSSGLSTKFMNYYTHNLDLKANTNYNVIVEIKEVIGNASLQFVGSSDGTGSQFKSGSTYEFEDIIGKKKIQKIYQTRDSFENIDNGLRTYVTFSAGESGSITFRISVLEDTTITEDIFVYEEYGVMPSSEFPSKIRSVADDVNLFDGELEKGSLNGNTGDLANNDMIRSKNFIPVEELTDYKFSSTNPEIVRIFVYEYKEDYTYNMTINKDLTNIRTSYFTTNKETKYIKFRTSANITDTTSKIKLQKGTKATKWSPYGYGTVEITHAHHNLLKPTWAQDLLDRLGISKENTIYCITQIDSYRYLKYNRNLGSDTELNYFIKNFFKKNTQYTFKCILMKNNDSSSVNFGFVYDDDSYLTRNLETNANMTRTEYKITSEPNKTVKEVRIFNSSGDTYIDLDKCIIYEGTEDLDWEGYGKDTVIQTKPLRSLPNGVCDVKDKDKIIRNVKELILGKDTIFRVYASKEHSEHSFALRLSKIAKTGICSHYVPFSLPNQIGTKDGIYLASTINIIITDMRFSTVEEFQNFLEKEEEKGTPVTVCYELAEPEIEEEPCEELKNLHTYKNITNVTTEGDIKPTLDVTYFKDLETMFKNLEK